MEPFKVDRDDIQIKRSETTNLARLSDERDPLIESLKLITRGIEVWFEARLQFMENEENELDFKILILNFGKKEELNRFDKYIFSAEDANYLRQFIHKYLMENIVGILNLIDERLLDVIFPINWIELLV